MSDTLDIGQPRQVGEIFLEELRPEDEVYMVMRHATDPSRRNQVVRLQVVKDLRSRPGSSFEQPPEVRVSRWEKDAEGHASTFEAVGNRHYALLGSWIYNIASRVRTELPTEDLKWMVLPESSLRLEPRNDHDLQMALGGYLIEALGISQQRHE